MGYPEKGSEYYLDILSTFVVNWGFRRFDTVEES